MLPLKCVRLRGGNVNNTRVLNVLKVSADLGKINMFIDRLHGTNGVSMYAYVCMYVCMYNEREKKG